MRDRLIELIVDAENAIYQEKPYSTDTERYSRVADHLLAEGVIVLPCKVGDTLYEISRTTNSIDDGYEFIGIESSRNGKWEDTMVLFKLKNGYRFRTKYHFYWRDIGKTIFLTREEAEKALEGSKGK